MILGIYHPARGVGHDTGVALIDRQGHILAALSEERLSRVKMDGGFPFRALEMIRTMTGVEWRDLDAVAVPFLAPWDQLHEGARLLLASASDPALLTTQWATRRGKDRFQAGMTALGAYGYLDEFKRRSAAVRAHDHRPAVSDWREFLSVSGLATVPLVQAHRPDVHRVAPDLTCRVLPGAAQDQVPQDQLPQDQLPQDQFGGAAADVHDQHGRGRGGAQGGAAEFVGRRPRRPCSR